MEFSLLFTEGEIANLNSKVLGCLRIEAILVFIVLQGKEKLGFIHLPQPQNNMINSHTSCKPCCSMNVPPGGMRPAQVDYVSVLTILIISLPPTT